MRNLVAALLLATLCIGGTELAFCSVADPELFREVTGPVVAVSKAACARVSSWASYIGRTVSDAASAVRDKAVSVSNTVTSTVTSTVTTFIEDAKAALEPPEEPQIADGPAIEIEEDITDPAVTEFDTSTGTEILTGGNIPLTYYNQKDKAWAGQPYGNDNIGFYGCGPTCMSMVVSSLTEYSLNPAEMSAWCASQGYWAPQSGSYLSLVAGTAEHYGLSCTSLDATDPSQLTTQFASDSVIVALMGSGHFTKNGHFIVLHGTTLDGRILVADPNSRENSLTAWDPQTILDELSTSTSDGAPLWLITTPKSL